MARYLVLAQMLAVPKPMPVGQADTPAEALRKARELEKAGRDGIQIGDTEAEQYFSIAQFAAQHGIR
ncbi:MAG: hypothetical protein NT015_18120 [Alphaproteobacteria bacterium]|nr:hypothetical protein [Alphaproteobacteria bacterium]